MREVFEKLGGPEAPKCHRCCGAMTTEDLENGAAADLVDGLSTTNRYECRVLVVLESAWHRWLAEFGYSSHPNDVEPPPTR